MGRKILSLVCIVAVQGCGGGGGGDSPQAALSCDTAATNQSAATTVTVAGSTAGFEQSVQKTLAQIAVNQCVQAKQFGGTVATGKGDFASSPSAPPTAAPAPTTTAPASGQVGGGSAASRTNVQEQGVDEADLVKYNGKYLFVGKRAGGVVWFGGGGGIAVATPVSAAAPPPVRALAPTNNTVRILAPVTDSAAVSELGTVTLAAGSIDLAALYVGESNSATADQLVTLSRHFNWDARPVADQPVSVVLALAPTAVTNATRVELFDVAQPSAPSARWQLEMQGEYISSRRIGDTLFLVTQYAPYLPQISAWPNSQTAFEQQLQAIKQIAAADLLPYAQVNGELANVVDPASCVITADPGAYIGQLALTSIIAIDLAQMKINNSACVIDTTSSWTQSVYASTNNIYVNGMQYLPEGSRTSVYQFALSNNTVGFSSYGTVPGNLAGSNAPYSMSEEAGYLRVLTTQWNNGFVSGGEVFRPAVVSGPEHKLFVLKAENGQLSTVAQLPNEQHPDAIGKPNESVHAVRFFGSRAYVVTFRNTDPLYVLDLSDPLHPVVAGALEMPGFSDYLHPVGEKHVIGIGNDADPFGMVQGVKLGLFDISNPQKPVELKNFLIGERGSATPVNFDPHAFTMVSDAQTGNYRLALPVQYHAGTTNTAREPWQHTDWQYNGLFLFNLNVASATPEFNNVGVIKAQQATTDKSFPTGDITSMRSVIIGDNVHFISDAQVWSAPWNTPTHSVGPQ